jgi:L-lactate dehydrogenase complex protein LldG
MVEEDTHVSAARNEVLRRIRSAQLEAPPPVPRNYRRRGERSALDRVSLFCDRAHEYGAEVHQTSDIRAAITKACSRRGARRIGIPTGFHAHWRPQLDLVEDHGMRPDELETLDAAVTACTLAVAELGMIALSGRPAEGRRALTLIPDLHVCVIEANQIVDLLPEAFARLESAARGGRSITLIAGPSATSDIELKRVEGVHGPRNLVLIVGTAA